MTDLIHFLNDTATVVGVVEEAFDVLEKVGVLVEDAETAGLLLRAGARETPARHLIPRGLVLACLATCPRRVVLHDREGEPRLELGAGRTHFAPGSAALEIHEASSGRHRPAELEDLLDLVHLTHGLEAMSAQSTSLVPADAPEPLRDKLRLLAALVHGTKPVITGTFREDSFAVMKRMLGVLRDGDTDLAARPFAVFDCCPTPPLAWSRLSCRTLLDGARAGIPVQIVSMPIAGVSAPVTFRERWIQHVAEDLSGLVLHQLAGPGSPLIFGGAAATCDMRLGTTPTAGPESILMGCAVARAGRHLGLPTQFFLGLSDAKVPGWQAGVEAGTGLILGTLAGIDLITGAGMMDFIGCFSLEKLLLDAEICRSIQHMLAFQGSCKTPGQEGPAPPAAELLGPMVASGAMLAHPHTRRNFRRALHAPGPVFDRSSRGGRQGSEIAGAMERARDEGRRRLDSGPPPLLDERRRACLVELMTEEAERLGVPFPEGIARAAGERPGPRAGAVPA